MRRSGWAALCAAGAMAVAGQAAAADIFTLQNTFGGDGFVTLLPGGGFDVFGANNGTSRIFSGDPLSSLTTYTATAGTDETLAFDWTYMSNDLSGSQYDPGGYILNGVQFQVSPATSDPATFSGLSGHLVLNLTAGDTYGFYIFSTDSQTGRADISVTPYVGGPGEVALAGVPEPASWAMMITGFFGLGAVLRRRRAVMAQAA